MIKEKEMNRRIQKILDRLNETEDMYDEMKKKLDKVIHDFGE